MQHVRKKLRETEVSASGQTGPVQFQTPINFSSGTGRGPVYFLDLPLKSDHDRIEDIPVDVARCVRRAIEALDDLPLKGGDFWHHDLFTKAKPGKFRGDDFRSAARRALRGLATIDPEQAPRAHDRACRLLRDALERSHRAVECLAAEREIAGLRSRNG